MDYTILTPLQLSSHLRALRKVRGLSQSALGQMLGVGQTRVARIESAPTAISVEQFIELLAALNVRLMLRDVQTAAASEAAPGPKAAAADMAKASPVVSNAPKARTALKATKAAKTTRLGTPARKAPPRPAADGDW